ncbi:hypothetical protein, partial [Pseudomonas savastanoi]|uniref:hypothetical protein n=1 Tax=Pseudomonas savastanoi TaxID=29438 RepID=UPI001C811122
YKQGCTDKCLGLHQLVARRLESMASASATAYMHIPYRYLNYLFNSYRVSSYAPNVAEAGCRQDQAKLRT